MVGLDERGVDGIRSINEHWDGGGIPDGIAGEAIPLLARDHGHRPGPRGFELTRGGAQHALEVLQSRAAAPGSTRRSSRDSPGRRARPDFWEGLDGDGDLHAVLAPLEPGDRLIVADETRMDRVAEAFARVIDAKSPYTARHSDGVARFAVLIAERLGFEPRDVRDLRRAGLLHDIGKLGVSNRILDKPGKLDEEEWKQMRRHPELTARILGQVERLRDLAAMAAAHHERLDGRGYHLGLTAEQLDPSARVLAVADVAEALSADRPYRAGLAPDAVLDIIGKDAGTALDADAFVALREAWAPAPVLLQLAA